jgi:hypothetical protein
LFLIMDIPVRVRWNLIVLICIFFMAGDVEHFFMYLLALWTSSFENYLSN